MPTRQQNRKPAHNSGFASCGVTVVNSSVVFQSNFSAMLTVLCPEIPHERKAAKRWSEMPTAFRSNSAEITSFVGLHAFDTSPDKRFAKF